MQLIDLDAMVAAGQSATEIWGRLVETAVRHHASDIHMAFQADGLHVALRVDGRLVEQGIIRSADDAWRLLNHVKVLGEIDLGERRRPQAGRALVNAEDRQVDLRVSLLPTLHGQDCVIRVLDRRVSLMSVEQLGMRRRELNRLFGLLASPSGLVVVTGPTGAGKTTTLYAAISRLNDGSRKIITIENPIEYDIPGVVQSQVNYRIGVDYASLLPTVLQHDPDIIMIGEIRDRETATAAVRAAVTGHLVFATMHSLGAAATIQTLLSLDVPPHFIARALRGAVAQNLVRRVCPACAEPIPETESVLHLDDIRHLLEPGQTPRLVVGRGCAECFGSGYRGRMGLFEIMAADETIRHLIDERRPASDIHRAAVEAGMVTIEQTGKLAAFLGHTTVEEVVRVVTP